MSVLHWSQSQFKNENKGREKINMLRGALWSRHREKKYQFIRIIYTHKIHVLILVNRERQKRFSVEKCPKMFTFFYPPPLDSLRSTSSYKRRRAEQKKYDSLLRSALVGIKWRAAGCMCSQAEIKLMFDSIFLSPARNQMRAAIRGRRTPFDYRDDADSRPSTNNIITKAKRGGTVNSWLKICFVLDLFAFALSFYQSI